MMQYNFRASVSANGHAKDELLSALQKYIRRGEKQKALYVAIELELFSSIPEAKALVTNTINRLRVILGEETACGLTSPALVRLFDNEYKLFESARTEPANVRHTALINMVSLLAAAPKQRLVSDIKAVYLTPAAKEFALASSDPVLKGLYAEAYTIDDEVRGKFHLLPADDAVVLRPIVDGIITGIKRRSDTVFYWLNKLVEANEAQVAVGPRVLTAKTRPTAHPMHLLFEICRAYLTNGERLWKRDGQWLEMSKAAKLAETLEICARYYSHFGLVKGGVAKSHRDWIIFTIWPLLYCVRDVDWAHNVPQVQLVTPQEAEQVYTEHAVLPALVIDDYALDQHTARGRQLKRKADFFATVGAVVNNADDSLFVPAYRRLYEAFKQHQATGDTSATDDTTVASTQSAKKAK